MSLVRSGVYQDRFISLTTPHLGDARALTFRLPSILRGEQTGDGHSRSKRQNFALARAIGELRSVFSAEVETFCFLIEIL